MAPFVSPGAAASAGRTSLRLNADAHIPDGAMSVPACLCHASNTGAQDTFTGIGRLGLALFADIIEQVMCPPFAGIVEPDELTVTDHT